MQVFFASSRLNEGNRSDPNFGIRKHLDIGSGELEYGTASLRTPQNLGFPSQCQTGPQYRDLIKANTDSWHTARTNFVGCFNEEDLLEKVRNCHGKICIYIHGYDKTFNEALQDTAMLAADYAQYADSQKGFVPILFSWPSCGERSKYAEDEANIDWSQKSFDHFLEKLLKEKSADSSLDIVAHSMGNRLIFAFLTNEHPQSNKPWLKNLFLCSGDVDFHAVESAREKLESCVSGMIYIFVSDKDRPLIMSQYIHGDPRLGRPIDPPGGNTSPSDGRADSAKGSAKQQSSLADKIASSEFWKQLTIDAAELWLAPSFTDTPDVLAWLKKNPSLDREFGEKSRLLDVSELSISNLGHAVAWPVVSSIMAGNLNFPQLRGSMVHKRPDRNYIEQCGGKPLVLYRYTRFDPF